MINTIIYASLDAIGNLLFFIAPFVGYAIYQKVRYNTPLSYWFEEDEGDI